MKKVIVAILCIAIQAMSTPSSAQEGNAYYEVKAEDLHSHNSNPWGLVYADAITQNVPSKVNIHTVCYDLDGKKIFANIYTPAGYDKARTYPAIVIAHPNGGVKEQVAGLYG